MQYSNDVVLRGVDPLWPDLLQSIVIEAIIFAIFAILDYYLSHNFQAKKTLANKEILSLNTLVFKNFSVFWWKHHYLETLITGISPLTWVPIA